MKTWPTIPILEVATIISARVEPFDGKRNYVATGGLDGGTVVSWEEVDFDSKPSRADLVAKLGDVLFARMQATNKVAPVTKESQNYIWSTGFAVLRPKANLLSRYLMHYLASPFFQAAKDAHCTGATQKSLPNDGLRKLTIPVPPLADQEWIVKILDEADELQKLRAQTDRRTANLIPALFHELFGDPAVSDSRWQIVSLKDMGKVTTGNTPSRKIPEYFGNFIEWIKTDNIDVTHGTITATSERLSEKGTKVGRVVASGSILVTCIAGSRDYLGDAAVVDRQVAINQQINAITPNHDVDSYFLCEMVVAMKKVIQHRATGVMTGIINKSTLESIPLICPPLPLQKEFGQHVREIRELEASQATSRTRLDALFQSMSHRAFNGEL